MDSGGVGIAVAARRDRGRLGDDQSSRGALGIVLGIQPIGHMALRGPATGERGHEDPVRQSQRTECHGREERGMGHRIIEPGDNQ